MDNKIAYASFIPLAVKTIRSMLSFEKSVAQEVQDAGPEAEDNFYLVLDEAFADLETLEIGDFMMRLEECAVLDWNEIRAARHLLAAYDSEIPVEDAKTQVWSLVKNMRRHKT